MLEIWISKGDVIIFADIPCSGHVRNILGTIQVLKGTVHFIHALFVQLVKFFNFGNLLWEIDDTISFSKPLRAYLNCITVICCNNNMICWFLELSEITASSLT